MKTPFFLLITIGLVLGCGEKQVVKPQPNDDPDKDAPRVTKEIPVEGGAVGIANVVDVVFPGNSFPTPTSVTVIQSSEDETTQEYYDNSALMFGAENYLDYFAKINTGREYPSGNIQIRLMLTDDIINSLEDGYKFEVLALLNQSDGEEGIMGFAPVIATYNAAGKFLDVSLENYYFDNTETSDETWQAVLTIATLPGQNPNGGRVKTGECEGFYISCPLATCQVSSPFNPQRKHPVTGQVRPHNGVDLVAAVNTPVKAAYDGKVVSIRPLRGYGNAIIIRHVNSKKQSFTTLYAHLNTIEVTEGQLVEEGDLIALSGNTGITSGPHLHFEYFINANAGNLNQYIDPMPLVNTTSIRLVSASAALTGINNCSGNSRSTWKVVFDYKDPSNQIDPGATLTFQDIEPVTNPPYTVSIGSLVTEGGLVNSPDFCARFNELTYFKVKVYLTSKGVQSNCIYFYLNKVGDAMRANPGNGESGRIGTSNL